MKLQILMPRGLNPKYAFVRLHLQPHEKEAADSIKGMKTYTVLPPSEYGIHRHVDDKPVGKAMLLAFATAAVIVFFFAQLATSKEAFGFGLILAFVAFAVVYYLYKELNAPPLDEITFENLVKGTRIEMKDYDQLQQRLVQLKSAVDDIGRQLAENEGYPHELEVEVERVPASQLKAA